MKRREFFAALGVSPLALFAAPVQVKQPKHQQSIVVEVSANLDKFEVSMGRVEARLREIDALAAKSAHQFEDVEILLDGRSVGTLADKREACQPAADAR